MWAFLYKVYHSAALYGCPCSPLFLYDHYCCCFLNHGKDTNTVLLVSDCRVIIRSTIKPSHSATRHCGESGVRIGSIVGVEGDIDGWTFYYPLFSTFFILNDFGLSKSHFSSPWLQPYISPSIHPYTWPYHSVSLGSKSFRGMLEMCLGVGWCFYCTSSSDTI